MARAQPKRSSADTARVREAETALAAAVAIANDAKTLQEACNGLIALTPKISALQLIRPPKGFERDFSEHRNGLGMQLDVMVDQNCAAGSDMSENIIRSGLESLAKEFVRFEEIGAKP